MLDPVIVPTLYFVAVLQLILTGAVAYYAFRITKLTGSFRAWTLIIFAFILLTVRNVLSLTLTLSLPADQLGTLIESVGVMTTIISQVVNVLANAALFLGMFGLVKRFQNQAKLS